jgi:cytochrome P450
MLNSDPPDHASRRRPVQRAFMPRRVAQLPPRTEESAAGLLDAMAARGDVADNESVVRLPARMREIIMVALNGQGATVQRADRGDGRLGGAPRDAGRVHAS